jgi:hypothetical protein
VTTEETFEAFLVDEPLVADPEADRELGRGDSSVEALSDEDIAGARFLLTRRAIERVEQDTFEGLAVALDANFQAPPGARFTDATVRMLLTSPDEARFEDVGPVTDPNPHPVKVSITRGGKVSLSVGEVAEAELSAEKIIEFTKYTCRIQGLGAGTQRATWKLEEDIRTRDGIGRVNRLMVTLPGEGPFVADLLLRCQIRRPGIAGAVDRVRELVLGPRLNHERRREIRLQAPPKEERKGWFFGFG